MTEYKYSVWDDGHRITQKIFDNFDEALAYAKLGLVTFVEEIPYVDGIEDEDNVEIVWSWDSYWDDDVAKDQVAKRHAEITEDPELEEAVRIEADHPAELASFAKLVLGNDFDAFNCDFDDCKPEDVEVDVAPADFDYEISEPSVNEIEDADPFDDDFYGTANRVETSDSDSSEDDDNDGSEESTEPSAAESTKDSEESEDDDAEVEESDDVDDVPEEEKEMMAEIEKTPADEKPMDMVDGKLVPAKDPKESEVEVSDAATEDINESLVEDVDDLDDFIVGSQSDEMIQAGYEAQQEYEASLKKWDCYFDNNFVGTVLAADEDEAYAEMEATWPEFNYGEYDGVAEVMLSEDDLSDEEFLEEFGKAMCLRHDKKDCK